MSDIGIGAQDFREMMVFVAGRIAEEAAHLNALDAAIGDGDHGITMQLGFEAVTRKLDELDMQTGIDNLLVEAGMAFMAATGGASGVVFGKMFMAGGRALKGLQQLGPPEFKSLLKAMESSVSSSGKVKPGDKTVLDAVAGAFQTIADSEATLLEVFTQAATASEAAAQGTANILCRVGRASRLGDRALGHPDPGAVSFSIILRAMADWLAARQGSLSWRAH
jgi:dihydroxyacetone kinase phosphoprotein-dependent L subunit